MNIFIMILMFVFMAGYYFMDSPSQRVAETELEHAITRTELRSVAECAASAHTAAIKDYILDDICMQEYGITSQFICLNERQSVVKCEIVRNKKPAFSFIITSTLALPDGDYNNMLEILETYYPKAGTFGIFMENYILAGGGTGKRPVPKSIVKEADLYDGQLVYMTQYSIPDVETEFVTSNTASIRCPAGTVKTYRFGRWQCTSKNEKASCSGDNIWDSDLGECIPDEARKPLCASKQTAVMVDDIWECIDPFLEKTCPGNMIARLNYNTLEWECIEDPTTSKNPSKCTPKGFGAVYGTIGATLNIPSASCTDCEEIITNPETCVTYCVPSPAKLNDPKCYPNPKSCSGPNRAFYFGFPSTIYATKVSAVANYSIPMDPMHSKNRKFNCLDCGDRNIDTKRSLYPYIAVCE